MMHTRLSVKAEATSSDRRYWLFHVAGVRETPAEPSAPQPSSTWVSGQILQSLCQEIGAGGRKAPASRQPGHPFTRIQHSEGHGHPQALAPLPKSLRSKGLTQRGGAVQTLHPPRKHWVLLDPGNVPPEKRVHTCALTDIMLTGCLSDSSMRVQEAPEQRKHLHGDRNFNLNLWRLPF